MKIQLKDFNKYDLINSFLILKKKENRKKIRQNFSLHFIFKFFFKATLINLRSLWLVINKFYGFAFSSLLTPAKFFEIAWNLVNLRKLI